MCNRRAMAVTGAIHAGCPGQPAGVSPVTTSVSMDTDLRLLWSLIRPYARPAIRTMEPGRRRCIILHTPPRCADGCSTREHYRATHQRSSSNSIKKQLNTAPQPGSREYPTYTPRLRAHHAGPGPHRAHPSASLLGCDGAATQWHLDFVPLIPLNVAYGLWPFSSVAAHCAPVAGLARQGAHPYLLAGLTATHRPVSLTYGTPVRVAPSPARPGRGCAGDAPPLGPAGAEWGARAGPGWGPRLLLPLRARRARA